MKQSADFYLTGIAAADELLARDPNAVLLGMVLDQQVPMEKAFSGPAVIAERMGATNLDVAAIADADPAEFAALCARPPAVHRFPGSMAARIQALCRELVQNWDGDVANLYAAAATGADLKNLLKALPGFGEQKAQIFVALLGKQHGVTPPGWREAAGDFGPAGIYYSVADIVDPESLVLVRAAKRAAKAAAKSRG
jgi:uncharacterized HhH-GPD family protein